MDAQEKPTAPRVELPVYGQREVPERADAQRNRRILLEVARQIMLTRGVDAVTMDELADQAGVGVGTVYRRFGDRSGLAQALLDEDEKLFQRAYVSGPAPLGPGAPPVERIRAFFSAYGDRLENHVDLLMMAECIKSEGPFYSGAYQSRRTHLYGLLREAGLDEQAQYLADALLSLVDPSLYAYQRRRLGMSTEAIKDGIDSVVAGAVFHAVEVGNLIGDQRG